MKKSIHVAPYLRSLIATNLAMTLGCSGAATAEDSALMEDPESADEAQHALIGGNRITQAYFNDNNHARAVVRFRFRSGRCTATKIGPNQFLTAAMCVRWRSGNVRVSVGDKIDITNAIDGSFEGAGVYLNRTVEALHIHSSYLAYPDQGEPADIAVITVNEPTHHIDSFDGDISRQHITDTMWGRAVGYGCETNDYEEKQWGEFQAYSRGAVSTSDPWATEVWDEMFERNIISFTPNRRLCHTDLGGPLFRHSGGAWHIIGVNSGYHDGAWEDAVFGDTDWSGFTRVDDIDDFFDDVHSECSAKCSRDLTKNIQSSMSTAGLQDAILSCIAKC